MENVIVHDHRDRWDEADVDALRYWLSEGLTYEQCSAHRGRTVWAVAKKAQRLRKAGLL
jgi:hypothetical protein